MGFISNRIFGMLNNIRPFKFLRCSSINNFALSSNESNSGFFLFGGKIEFPASQDLKNATKFSLRAPL